MSIEVIDSEKVTNFIEVRQGSGMIVAAFNLFMIGFLRHHPEFKKNAVFWCDGVMGLVFLKLKNHTIKRLRGVEMLKSVLLANKKRSVCVLGTCTEADKNLLAQYDVKVIQQYELISLNLMTMDISSLTISSDFVLVTLPSPKQELLSLQLSLISHNSNKHFICIGGALNMLSNPKLDCPRYLQIIGFEFLFRLKTDTHRRVKRLLKSLFDAAANLPRLIKCKIFIITK